jgi:hypothetical protein
VIDDLLPQANWPEGHAPKVPALIDDIERRREFATVRLAWASGLMLVVRRAGQQAITVDAMRARDDEAAPRG